MSVRHLKTLRGEKGECGDNNLRRNIGGKRRDRCKSVAAKAEIKCAADAVEEETGVGKKTGIGVVWLRGDAETY